MIGGAGAALFSLILPALVVRHLTKLEFSVWTLALQVLIYVQLFGLGLQTVVTYRVARAKAQDDMQAQRDSLAAGFVLGRYFAGAAAIAVVVLVILYPVLFDNVPPQMVGQFRLCVALFGFAAACQLLALVPIGAFMGLQRNIVPVVVQLGSRCLGLAAAGVALFLGADLLALSTTIALSSALVAPAMFWVIRWQAVEMISGLSKPKREYLRSMWTDCAGLAVWNVAMLLVNGIDTAVVGHFDFEKVAAYSLATTVITILVGVLQAILNPLVAMGSSLSIAEQHADLRQLLLRASRYCAVFLVTMIIAFMLLGKALLPYWTGPEYVDDVYRFLAVLLVAHSVRNLMAPYAVLLVSIGMQRKALFPALAEGLVNLVVSIFLARSLGAIGVAYGTLLGAIAGVLVSTIFVVKQTSQLVESRTSFVRNVLIVPMSSLIFLFFYSIK